MKPSAAAPQLAGYHRLIERVLDEGTDQLNTRTGHVCRAVVGAELVFDLRQGLPALTTRKIPIRAIVGELLAFFRGCDNAAAFEALGCGFWAANANETRAWVANPARRGHNDLGRIYSRQWTDWRDSRVAMGSAERDALAMRGYAQRMHDPVQGAYLMERGINQLEQALAALITDPSDRGIIVSAWRPDEFDRMALRPCHVDYRFVAFEAPRVLHVVMTIRSWDLFLGAPANILSTALFLSVMARLAGFEPGTVTLQAANVHLYDNHFDQARELLEREHLPSPRLVLAEAVAPVAGLGEIPGAFARIAPEHVMIEGYRCHSPIKAAMAA